MEQWIEININISRYAFSSFGTAFLVLFMLIVSLIFYFVVQKDPVLLYTMTIELMMFLYMFFYGILVSSMTAKGVILSSKWIYISILGLLNASLYTVSYLKGLKYRWTKKMMLTGSSILAILIAGTDWVITNEVAYIFHPTAIKGEGFMAYMIFSGYGVLVIMYGVIKGLFDKTPEMKGSKYIYIGISFFLIHMYITGFTSIINSISRPRVFIDILFYAIMISIFFYEHVRDNIRKREQLFNQYIEDEMTGVYSRNYFEMLKKALRWDPYHLLIGMIDLNQFKLINDGYGHMIGDQVLVGLGEIFRQLDDDYVVGRIGGDEFMIFCRKRRETELIQTISEVMNRYSDLLDQLGIENEDNTIGMSFGYARSDNTMAFEDLITECDAAMYKAKNIGNNEIKKYTKTVY